MPQATTINFLHVARVLKSTPQVNYCEYLSHWCTTYFQLDMTRNCSSRVSNVKNWHLQNNLLTAVILYVGPTLNTAAAAVNPIAFLGWKSIEMCENHDTMSCNFWKRWSFITILHLNLPMWANLHQKVLVVW